MKELHANMDLSKNKKLTKESCEQLFCQAYKNYKDHYYQVSLRITHDTQAAEDIVHDVFIKLWQHKETLNDIKSISNYLAILTRNSSIDYLRRCKQTRTHTNRYTQTKNTDFDLIEHLNQRETEQLLQLAIQSLSPQRKTVFVLGWLEGWSRDRKAEHLNISPNTVRNLMQSARHDIRHFFTKQTGMKRVSVLKIMKNVWCNDKAVKVA